MRTRWWTLLAVVLGLVGLAASAFGAEGVANRDRADAVRSFNVDAGDVAAAMKTEVGHVQDLTISAQAFVRRSPDLTTSELRSWADDVSLFERYPAVVALANMTVVTRAELPAFITKITADPPDNSEPGVPFHLEPPGVRDYYCFMDAGLSRPVIREPIGKDLCPGVTPEMVAIMKSFDKNLEVAATFHGKTYLSISIPRYRTREIPATAEARQAQFVGLFGLMLDPTSLLERAVANHRGMVASFDYTDLSKTFEEQFANGSFKTGTMPSQARTRVVDLGEGWTVTVAQRMPTFGLLDRGAVKVLLVGSLLSLLLSVLLWVLATGRARALRLVALTTGELRHQALHDPLTGLANRALLNDRVDQLLVRSRRNGATPACLYLDIDGFKNINDTLGHEAGDLLLCSVAARLQNAVREADTIARMGGDEFVVLLDGATMEAAPGLVAERIIDVLRQPFEVDRIETVMRVTASIGIASGDRDCGDDLVRDADLALYQAKDAGKNRAVDFRPDMQAMVQKGFELEFDLRGALENEQFRLVYQPIYNLDDLTLVGVEALLRWEHPTLGVVQPCDFIPTLERTGQIVEVGRWVLAEACRQLAAWRRQGSLATVSVNVSSQQFDTGTLVDDVQHALAAASLEPSALTIEITESSLMRSLEVCIDQLRTLRDLGVLVAIDDFGTGYSSLASLQRLPVDSLKIDRSFVSTMGDTNEARALVHAIVQLGKDLGLRTLAEGVETTEQVDQLRGDRIDEAQGFLLARPLEPADVKRLILDGIRVPLASEMG